MAIEKTDSSSPNTGEAKAQTRPEKRAPGIGYGYGYLKWVGQNGSHFGPEFASRVFFPNGNFAQILIFDPLRDLVIVYRYDAGPTSKLLSLSPLTAGSTGEGRAHVCDLSITADDGCHRLSPERPGPVTIQLSNYPIIQLSKSIRDSDTNGAPRGRCA